MSAIILHRGGEIVQVIPWTAVADLDLYYDDHGEEFPAVRIRLLVASGSHDSYQGGGSFGDQGPAEVWLQGLEAEAFRAAVATFRGKEAVAKAGVLEVDLAGQEADVTLEAWTAAVGELVKIIRKPHHNDGERGDITAYVRSGWALTMIAAEDQAETVARVRGWLQAVEAARERAWSAG